MKTKKENLFFIFFLKKQHIKGWWIYTNFVHAWCDFLQVCQFDCFVFENKKKCNENCVVSKQKVKLFAKLWIHVDLAASLIRKFNSLFVWNRLKMRYIFYSEDLTNTPSRFEVISTFLEKILILILILMLDYW